MIKTGSQIGREQQIIINQSVIFIKMIEKASELDPAEIEKEFVGEREQYGPVKFDISSLLKDQYTRRELLTRMRGTVADPQARKLIDICLDLGQSEVEKAKNKERLNLHARQRALEHQISHTIQEIQRTIKENEVLEPHCQEHKSLEELKEKKEELIQQYSSNIKRHNALKKSISEAKKQFELNHCQPKEKIRLEVLRKEQKEKSAQITKQRQQLNKSLKQYRRLENQIFGVNIETEKKMLANGQTARIEIVQSTKVVEVPQEKEKRVYIGPVASNFNVRYIALFIAVGIIWSLILASKAYRYN